jgi:hypothetical protein
MLIEFRMMYPSGRGKTLVDKTLIREMPRALIGITPVFDITKNNDSASGLDAAETGIHGWPPHAIDDHIGLASCREALVEVGQVIGDNDVISTQFLNEVGLGGAGGYGRYPAKWRCEGRGWR